MTGLLPAPGELLLFAASVFVLNATPGVDLLLTVSRTLTRGARAGAAAALGIGTGCVVHALAAAFGLAALLVVHPQAYVALQRAGAGYLLWIAFGLLRRARHGAPMAAPPAADDSVASRWVDFRSGVLTNVLNPKVALFFLAFLPQFVPAGAPDKTLSFLLLGAWFVIQGTLFLLGLVALSARLARWRVPGCAQRGFNAAAGALFVALALKLLFARPAAA